MSDHNQELQQFSISVPRWLKDLIDKDAGERKPKISRSQQINLILEEHYEKFVPEAAVAETTAVGATE